jgi:hypothetical protein
MTRKQGKKITKIESTFLGNLDRLRSETRLESTAFANIGAAVAARIVAAEAGGMA